MATLRLALDPLVTGEMLAYTPPLVFFEFAGESGTRRGAGDFRPTNGFLNELQLSLLEATMYDGVAMWQFLPSYTWPAFHRTLELVDIVLDLVDDLNPKDITAGAAGDAADCYWRGVLEAVAAARGLPLALEGFADAEGPPEITRSRVRTAATRLRPRGPRRRRIAPHRDTLVLVTLGQRHWVGGRDEQFDPLLPALREAGWRRFVMLDTEAVPADELAARSGGDVEWRSLATYRPVRPPSHLPFIETWDDVKRLGVLSYKGIDLHPALGLDLARAFAQTLPDIASLLLAARRFLQEQRPSALLATYETGPWSRALIIESAFGGIPTIGLQHGMIFDNHYDYMHARVTADPVAAPLGFAVPSATCVWGRFWRDMLTVAGHYPNDAVEVVGNWRLGDRAARKPSDGDEANVLILTASQNVERFLSVAIDAAASAGCRPLVRLHPADDRESVRVLLGERGVAAAGGRLDEVLANASLVISQVSTIVAEAVWFGVPVVLVDLEDLGGWGAYEAAGVVVKASTPTELVESVARVLRDETLRRKLAEAGDALVAEWFEKGNASSRVACVVERMVRS
jgi:hypothetical protein